MNVYEESVLYDETPEQFVLSAILNTNEQTEIFTAFNMLKLEHFHNSRNRAIFEVMKNIYENEKIPIHRTTVLSKAEEMGLTDKVKRDYLYSLADDFKSFQNIEMHLKKLIEMANRRIYNIVLKKAQDSVYDLTQPLSDTASWVEQKTLDISGNATQRTVLHISEVMSETLKEIERAYTSKSGLAGISTCFTSLDKKLGGFEKGQLIVLAGRPGMGKTTLAMTMAYNMAFNYMKKILIFTYEVSQRNIYRKLLSIATDIPAYTLRTGRGFKPDYMDKVNDEKTVLAKLPIYVDDNGKDTVSSIRTKTMQLAKEVDGVDLVIIDHIQLMRSDRRKETRTRNDELGEISGELKKLATNLQIPILVLSQFNRDAVKGNKKEAPKISDLRDSGAIEQDADIVLIIHKPKTEDKTGLVVLHIGKNRDGMDGKVDLNITPHFTKFEDLNTFNNINIE